MSCPFSQSKEPNVTLNLLFHEKELLYHIGNIAYTQYHALKEIGEAQPTHLIADINEEGNADIVRRSLESAMAVVCDLLEPYINSVADTDLCNTPGDGDFILPLEFPASFGVNNAKPLEQFIHDFLVNSALRDWFVIVAGVKSAEVFTEQAMDALQQINSIKNKRRGIITRPLKPF